MKSWSGVCAAAALSLLTLDVVHASFLSAPGGKRSGNVQKSDQPAASTSASFKLIRKHNQTNHTVEAEKLKHATSSDHFHHYVRYQPVGQATGSVIWLNSWAAEPGWLQEWLGADFNRLVSAAPQTRVIEAVGRYIYHPPEAYRGWYSYEDWHNEIPIDSDVDTAAEYVHGLINQEYSIVQDYRHIVLAGYSQGANMALEASFRFSHNLGLVLAERGVMLEPRLYDPHSLSASPYVLTAGLDDTTYNVQRIKQGCRALQGKQTPTFLRTFAHLDHFGSDYRENQLAIASIVQALSQTPPASISSLGVLTQWSSC